MGLYIPTIIGRLTCFGLGYSAPKKIGGLVPAWSDLGICTAAAQPSLESHTTYHCSKDGGKYPTREVSTISNKVRMSLCYHRARYHQVPYSTAPAWPTMIAPSQIPGSAADRVDVLVPLPSDRQILPAATEPEEAKTLSEDFLAALVGRMVPISPDLLRATRAGDAFQGFGKALRGSKKLYQLLEWRFRYLCPFGSRPLINLKVDPCLP